MDGLFVACVSHQGPPVLLFGSANMGTVTPVDSPAPTLHLAVVGILKSRNSRERQQSMGSVHMQQMVQAVVFLDTEGG